MVEVELIDGNKPGRVFNPDLLAVSNASLFFLVYYD